MDHQAYFVGYKKKVKWLVSIYRQGQAWQPISLISCINSVVSFWRKLIQSVQSPVDLTSIQAVMELSFIYSSCDELHSILVKCKHMNYIADHLYTHSDSTAIAHINLFLNLF